MPTNNAPFISQEMKIEPEWIDYNGHLNLAYYHVLFDRCSDEAALLLDLGPHYLKQTNHTIYAAETHVCYLRELTLKDAVRCTFQLIAYDQKRMHIYLELLHADGWTAATSELMWLHIDQSGPRVAPFPNSIYEKIGAMFDTHKELPKPQRLGRTISLK